MLDSTHLMAYWQGPPLEANLLIALNLLGALLLGMLVGYERACSQNWVQRLEHLCHD